MLLNMFQVVKLLGLLPKTYSHQGPICSQISKNSLRINQTSMTIRACMTLMYKSSGVTWKPNKRTWERIYWNPDTMNASWESQTRRKSLFYHCGWGRKNHASTTSFQYFYWSQQVLVKGTTWSPAMETQKRIRHSEESANCFNVFLQRWQKSEIARMEVKPCF